MLILCSNQLLIERLDSKSSRMVYFRVRVGICSHDNNLCKAFVGSSKLLAISKLEFGEENSG